MDGHIVFNINGTELSGLLNIMGKDSAFTGGTIDENGNFDFNNEVNAPMGKLKITATGTLTNGKLDGVAKTKMGDFSFVSN